MNEFLQCMLYPLIAYSEHKLRSPHYVHFTIIFLILRIPIVSWASFFFSLKYPLLCFSFQFKVYTHTKQQLKLWFLLSKNVKIKIYRTVLSPVLLYGYKTSSQPPQGKILRIFEVFTLQLWSRNTFRRKCVWNIKTGLQEIGCENMNWINSAEFAGSTASFLDSMAVKGTCMLRFNTALWVFSKLCLCAHSQENSLLLLENKKNDFLSLFQKDSNNWQKASNKIR